MYYCICKALLKALEAVLTGSGTPLPPPPPPPPPVVCIAYLGGCTEAGCTRMLATHCITAARDRKETLRANDLCQHGTDPKHSSRGTQKY